MSALSLTAAVATYGHTRPLWDGTISSERVALEHIELSPITRAFRRMVRGLDFDISEMALSTYLCARPTTSP
jgi:4,5-dihydroxyphthalate decarboxylase